MSNNISNKPYIYDPANNELGKWPFLEQDQNNSRVMDSVIISIEPGSKTCELLSERMKLIQKEEDEKIELNEEDILTINKEFQLSFPVPSYMYRYCGAWKIFHNNGMKEKNKKQKDFRSFFNSYCLDDQIEMESKTYTGKIREYDICFPFSDEDLDVFEKLSCDEIDEIKDNSLIKNKFIDDYNWLELSSRLSLEQLQKISSNPVFVQRIVYSFLLTRQDMYTLEGLRVFSCFCFDSVGELFTKMLKYKDSVDFYKIAIEHHKTFSDYFKKHSHFKFFRIGYNYIGKIIETLSYANKRVDEGIVVEILRLFKTPCPYSHSFDVESMIAWVDTNSYSNVFFSLAEEKIENFWAQYSVIIERRLNSNILSSNYIKKEDYSNFIYRFHDKYDFYKIELITLNKMNLIESLANKNEILSSDFFEHHSAMSSWELDVVLKYKDKINFEKLLRPGDVPDGLYDEADEENVPCYGCVENIIFLSEGRAWPLECPEIKWIVAEQIDGLSEFCKKMFLKSFNSRNLDSKWANYLFFDKKIDNLPKVELSDYIAFEEKDENITDCYDEIDLI